MRFGVDGRDRPGPVVRDLLGPLEVLAVVVAVPQRRERRDDDHAGEPDGGERVPVQVAPVEPAHERRDPRAQQHGGAQRDERHRPSDAPKGQTGVRAVGERLQQGAER